MKQLTLLLWFQVHLVKKGEQTTSKRGFCKGFLSEMSGFGLSLLRYNKKVEKKILDHFWLPVGFRGRMSTLDTYIFYCHVQ